jgi:UDP-N-acetylmuramoylalanine-D-glutamate ligase
MVKRIAAAMSLLAFAVCLIVGGLGADNTFTTTVERALTAMAATMVIGLVLGAMARAMLEENLALEKEKLKKHAASAPPDDR